MISELATKVFSHVRTRCRSIMLRLLAPQLRTGPRLIIGARVTVRGKGVIDRGAQLQLADNAYIYVDGRLELGRNVYIGRNATISCYENVSIGDDVRIAERVSIHDENHVFEPVPLTSAARLAFTTAPIHIGARTWLGANVIVLAGVRIGADVVVGAGSVVVRDLPDGVLAVGAPARIVRDLTRIAPAHAAN